MPTIRRTVATVVAATTTALVLGATPVYAAPGADGSPHQGARHSLRSSVTDQNFYFVMGDRFQNGDETNDRGGLTGDRENTGYDPGSKAYYHGGDIEGLMSKLDYLEGLGTEAVWFTPIFKNKAVQPEDSSAGYHGYWITDFTQVDPHLGTNQDLSDLVTAAHRRGIKVFFDIITNHTADVIGYEEGARQGYVSKDAEPYRTADGTPFDDRDYAGTGDFPTLDPQVSFPYLPVLEPGEEDLKVPGWLNDTRYYHNRGDTTFTGEDSQYGDFFGLDDLFTEHPRVVRGMKQIYKTWVSEIGIDGYRIDTMKHVNDEFWQDFGPGVLRYARRHGKPEFFMFGEVYDDRPTPQGKAFTSHFSTHDKMQAVLDFPFQAAARNFVSKQTDPGALVDFFDDDDWYTDRDSNAYQLPTFLGNHDMGRIGYFLKQDNPGATDEELLDRDLLAHALMYLVRGNPVVYYGDEQGFTGSGGDQLARQDMFANAVTDWPNGFDKDSIGSSETPDEDNFDTSHPIYQGIADLARLTERHPALRNGAMQTRQGQGVFGFSRVDRAKRREYVVVLNASEEPRATDVQTFVPRGAFQRIYGTDRETRATDRDGVLSMVAAPLSATVYRSFDRIPLSRRAPAVALAEPTPSSVDRGRMEVAAEVDSDSFNEVTFQAKVAGRRWRQIGTDDNMPYRVFHDVSSLDPGTPLRYRAVVLDNNGHTRVSGARRTEAPSPAVTITRPADDANVTVYDPVTVVADVVPTRSSQRVLFERRVGAGEWERIGVDRSSPTYTVTDHIASMNLELDTPLFYRATLIDPGFPRVTSDEVRVVTAAPEPAYDSVTLAGSMQSELGCPGDWQPDCELTDLVFDTSDGKWHGIFTIPAGSYEWKMATGHSWQNPNFGPGGGSGNYSLNVPETTSYEFVFDQVRKTATATQVADCRVGGRC